MKKSSLLFGLLLCVFASQAQNYPLRAHLEDPRSFSIVIIPDPQSYNKFAANQPLFELQTAWVAGAVDSLNMLTALCTGDLVERTRRAPNSGVPPRGLSNVWTGNCPMWSARATTTTDTPSRRTA